MLAAVGPDATRCSIPWQGWALTAADLLVTRMMEIVVHADDLAASVGLPTPEFPDDGASPRCSACSPASPYAGTARRRVVRALSRPQRAPASVSAF